MSYVVRFSPEALDHLIAIEDYVGRAGSPLTAARYVDAIVSYCESLATFPQRGIRRDDLMSGLRITNHRRRTVIAFMVDTDAEAVTVLGVFRRGRDYESVIGGEPLD